MIGINFVYEKNELFRSLDIDIALSSNLTIDVFDFDTNSFDDLADYINFMDFDEYIFFGLGTPNRLIRAVSYLQTLVNIPIKFVSQSNFSNYLSDKELNILLNKANTFVNLDVNKAFLQGYRCFQTNLYPIVLRKGLIKHIKIDNLTLFLKENSNLLRYFGINSAIYNKEKKDQTLPIIHLNPENLILKTAKHRIIENQERLLQNINNFIHTGEIKETEIPLNYGTLVGLNKLHSLYFKNKTFYLDSEYTVKVGISGDSYQSIVNITSTIPNVSQIPLPVKQLYPALININGFYDNVKFVTAYNSYNLPFSTSTSFNWIGFETKENKMVLNIPTQRVFKVNTLYLNLFEQIIKNKPISSPEAKKVLETLRL